MPKIEVVNKSPTRWILAKPGPGDAAPFSVSSFPRISYLHFVQHYSRRDSSYTFRTSFMKTALITGITGQDGSYLAELLLSKGYQVYGIIRRASTFNTQRLDHVYVDPHMPKVRLRLLYGDLSDPG